MNFDQAIQDLDLLRDAVDNFRDTVDTCQTFGPDALPEHMGCSEANVFSDLLDALGLKEQSAQLRKWHMESEDPEEYRERHEDWILYP